MALAIADDLGAIVIIALFYAHDLAPAALGLALAGAVVLFVLNRAGVRSFAPYVIVGVFMWACVLKSGVHATLAGVALAFAIPLRRGGEEGPSMLERAENGLEPWVHFGVAPIFAFANAGVSLAGFTSRFDDRAYSTRDRGRTVYRQTDWNLRQHLDCSEARHRGDAAGRELEAGLWYSYSWWRWLHHESVHWHARIS